MAAEASPAHASREVRERKAADFTGGGGRLAVNVNVREGIVIPVPWVKLIYHSFWGLVEGSRFNHGGHREAHSLTRRVEGVGWIGKVWGEYICMLE